MRKIGKCHGCKQTSARDYDEKLAGFSGNGMYRRAVTFAVRTTRFGKVVKPSQDFECPRCSKQAWDGKVVDGYTTDHVCDARCTDAKGFRCECSCGGKNHGKGFLVCEPVLEAA